MKNWTDKTINWHQLPATEVKRLIATWGMTERQIANYDAKHAFDNPAPKAHVSNTSNPVDFPKTPAKKTTTKAIAKAPAKKVVQKATRQKHTGADGEIKFVEHRNLYVGFWDGRVVVTKRTEAQCREFLATTYGAD
jgi:hypothetical protein